MRTSRTAMAALAVALSAPALAGDDDDLTRYERAQLRQALADIGCRGGDLDKKRDGTYEVDDTRCPDGREYEFRFSRDFVIISGKRD